MKKLLSVLFLLSFTLASAYAQNIQVKGTVVSGSDNEPLPGVNVVVKGTTNGGITDLDGNFTLSVPADATLSITYIGFKSQEVAVNGKNSLKIVLQEDSETLDEVVVVGYGVQKKSVVTASIAKVSSEDLENKSPVRMDNALKGLATDNYPHNRHNPPQSFQLRWQAPPVSEPMYRFRPHGRAGSTSPGSSPPDGPLWDTVRDIHYPDARSTPH